MTLITNDEYGPGALALGESLRQTGTAHDLVVMVTDNVSQSARYVMGLRCRSQIVDGDVRAKARQLAALANIDMRSSRWIIYDQSWRLFHTLEKITFGAY